MKKIFFAATLFISLLGITSCEKDSGDAPVPPPTGTLALDFSSFKTAVSKANSSDGIDDVDSFFTYASKQILANWITIFESIAAVPVQAYTNFNFSLAPVHTSDGWSWYSSYTDIIGRKYTTELVGRDTGDRVEWVIKVSKDGLLGYENFPWITGWSSKDGRKGQWDVKVDTLDTDVLVTCAWAADGDKVESVTVTYALDHLCLGIMPFFNGSSITYAAKASDSAYDSSISANYNHLGLGFWTANIEWNSQTGAGRVNCQNKYGNTSWHCWDAHHNDK